MSTKKLSISLPSDIFAELEREKESNGKNRSEIIEDALRLWLKERDRALMAEGCRLEAEEDLISAKASTAMMGEYLASQEAED